MGFSSLSFIDYNSLSDQTHQQKITKNLTNCSNTKVKERFEFQRESERERERERDLKCRASEKKSWETGRVGVVCACGESVSTEMGKCFRVWVTHAERVATSFAGDGFGLMGLSGCHSPRTQQILNNFWKEMKKELTSPTRSLRVLFPHASRVPALSLLVSGMFYVRNFGTFAFVGPIPEF